MLYFLCFLPPLYQLVPSIFSRPSLLPKVRLGLNDNGAQLICKHVWAYIDVGVTKHFCHWNMPIGEHHGNKFASIL